MSILCSAADAVTSGSCPILFKVLKLNFAICVVLLHFSSFCCLSSVADFSNTEAKAATSIERAPFFTRAKSDAVYVCGLNVHHGYLSMAVFILIHRSHSYRWAAAAVPRSNRRSWALSRKTHVQDQVRYWVFPSMGLFKYIHVHHAASHVFVKSEGLNFPEVSCVRVHETKLLLN